MRGQGTWASDVPQPSCERGGSHSNWLCKNWGRKTIHHVIIRAILQVYTLSLSRRCTKHRLDAVFTNDQHMMKSSYHTIRERRQGGERVVQAFTEQYQQSMSSDYKCMEEMKHNHVHVQPLHAFKEKGQLLSCSL